MRSFSMALIVGSLVLSACGAPTLTPGGMTPSASPSTEPILTAPAEPTALPSEGEEPIYLAIIWHQHQPVYTKNPETGAYVRPWVRVHATKDYVDMAAILEQYPTVHATFNLTPSLIRQLDDLAAGAKDLYWVLAEIPAAELRAEQRQFILDRFFDTNRRIIARFPRYQDLLHQRDSSDDPLGEYSTQDFLDLQVLFNLAWVDPDWLRQEPLAGLVAKGEGFEEADKEILFAEHMRLIQEVIPVHRRLQDAGQIEVSMTPYAHPILPLLVSTDTARQALPSLELPAAQFVYAQDAAAQIELGVQLYEAHFGRPPRGMWPAEGSVAQGIVSMVAQNGIQWMASDEGVLAKSLGLDSFARDSSDIVVEADRLYRPYYVQGQRGGPVAIVFRDIVISDKVGFTYSGLPGSVAAADFVRRIHDIRDRLIASGVQGPHLVSVILDGENAWEHYENDGKDFLHGLYQRLGNDPLIRTVTPSEFLEIAPDQPEIEDLWAGSWINHDFSTWIGEEEENIAWERLAATREFLEEYITGRRKGQVSDQVLDQAQMLMYIAEGSDWFWWLGADQNSGNDESFDQQFRDTLSQVYLTLGEEPPSLLDVPIILQRAVSADRPCTALIEPTVDGVIEESEWSAAGLYLAHGGAMAEAQPLCQSLAYGFDSQNLYLGLEAADGLASPASEGYIEIYLSVPGGGPAGNSGMGFPANRMVAVRFADGELAGAVFYLATGDEEWSASSSSELVAPGQLELTVRGVEAELTRPVAWREGQMEMAIPLLLLGRADTGDRLTIRALCSQTQEAGGESILVNADQIPGTGPAVVVVPDLGTTTILVDVTDPSGDDHGPGSYIYPLEAVFAAGNFDVQSFQVGHDAENIVFKFTVRGPIDNPWGSPNGLSVQTLDVYIDADGDGAGGVAMLPGRNLAFQEGYAWDFAITAEGWAPGIYVPGDGAPQQVASAAEFQILADPGQRSVTLRVPKSILGASPETWRYAAALLSQDGYPSSDVMRVRDAVPEAQQWRIGGAPRGTTNHTRVMDLVWPMEGEQEAWLSDFTATDAPQAELAAGSFARVPMFGVDR